MSSITKFNSDTASLILGAVRAGASMAIAAEIAGISRMTLHRWLRQGERDEADGIDTEFARFAREHREADAAVLSMVERSLMRVAASGSDWRANLAVLKVKRPHEWNPDPDEATLERLIAEIGEALYEADAGLADWALAVLSGEEPGARPVPPKLDPVRVYRESDQAWAYVLDGADNVCCEACKRRLHDSLRTRPGLAEHIDRHEAGDP